MIVILLQSLTHLSKSYCLSLFKCQFDKEMTEVITTWDAPNRWRILVIFCCYFFFCSSNWRRISRSRRSTRPQKMPWASVSPGSRLRSTNSHPQTRSIINLYWQSHCPTKIWPRHTKSGNSWQGVMNTLQPGHPRTRRRNPLLHYTAAKATGAAAAAGAGAGAGRVAHRVPLQWCRHRPSGTSDISQRTGVLHLPGIPAARTAAGHRGTCSLHDDDDQPHPESVSNQARTSITRREQRLAGGGE